jgi:hypothetical protein
MQVSGVVTEDVVFKAYMTHLFAAGARFVIIYAINGEIPGTAPHRMSGTATSPSGWTRMLKTGGCLR